MVFLKASFKKEKSIVILHIFESCRHTHDNVSILRITFFDKTTEKLENGTNQY